MVGRAFVLAHLNRSRWARVPSGPNGVPTTERDAEQGEYEVNSLNLAVSAWVPE